MANSPITNSTEKGHPDSQAPYFRQLKRVDDLINRGGSLSGNERNCGFLNLGLAPNGSPRFATISNVAGVDFNDDGRSYCLTDWDRDGDIDVWTMNRTAPRVRFLKNNQTTGNAFVSFRLTGTTANRDAIGARVEVDVNMEGQPSLVLQKTLRAGEGFLSQSSKWLHFGLGNATRVSKVKVRWPGGKTEHFSNVTLNQYFDLKEKTGRASRVTFNRNPKPAKPDSGSETVPRQSSQASVLLTSRIPVPRLTYRRENSMVAIQFDDHRATLINLWAHWCIPCRQELIELNRRSDDLAAADVNVIALSADGVSEREGVSHVEAIEQANRVMQAMEPKFAMAFASKPMLHRLQFLDDLLFAQKRDIAIPTSFLIDRKGRLAAVFRGRLDVENLLRIVPKIDLTAQALYDEAMPFPGFWFRPKQQQTPLQIAIELRRTGHFKDAADYLLDHSGQLVRRKNFGKLAGQLGAAIAETDRPKAITLMRLALEEDAKNIAIMNNLAWNLSKSKEATPNELAEATKWAMSAAEATRFNSLPILDTLASVQLRRGQLSQAKTTMRHALKVAKQQKNSKWSLQIERRLRSLDTE